MEEDRMGTIWFCLVAIMLAMYVLLDGFDLGAGAIHLWIAKTDAERRQILASIGPVWDGNEVWLLAAGGTLYFAFPALRERLQRILSSADDGALAADFARGLDRVSQPREERGVGSLVGFFVLRFEPAVGGLLRRGAGKCGARRPAGCQRVLFRAVMDKFSAGRKYGNPRLVHDFGGCARIARTGHARVVVGAMEDEWRAERAGEEACRACLVGRGGNDRDRDRADLRGATASEGEFCNVAVGNCIAAAGRGRAGRGCFRAEETSRTEGVFRFVPLFGGDADQRGVRRLSHGAAGAQPGVLAYGGRREGRRVWIEGRRNLVDSGDDSRGGIFYVCVSFVFWESGSG